MIIDGLIVMTPSIILLYAVDMAGVLWLSFLASMVTQIAVWTYFILGHGLYGRTVGKKLQVLRVVDFGTEAPITMLQSLRRESPFIVVGVVVMSASALIDFIPITNETMTAVLVYGAVLFQLAFIITQIAYCLNSPKRRAIHDLIGGTVVVRDNVPLVSDPNDVSAPSRE